jgi:adenylate kinase
MKDILLFGVQGSGKGTQAKLLAKKYGYTIFETGAELRLLSQTNSPLGEKIHSIISKGLLVDAHLVMDIVEDFLQRTPLIQPILFDGIPRNTEQKEAFDALMEKYHKEVQGIHITLSKEEALDRILGRFICKGVKDQPISLTEEECIAQGGEVIKRQDDTDSEAIKKRIELFFKETLPIISQYEKEGKIVSVNGNQTIERVFEDISQAL